MSDATADPAESIRRNTLFGLGVQLSGALMTGILTLFLVRELGPADYGIFVLAVGVGTLLLLPSDFGISRSAARFIAERRGDYPLAGRILGDALSLKLVGAGLASLGLIALAEPIASAYGIPELEWPLRLVALAVFGQSMMVLFAGFFEAVGRNSLNFRLAFSESTLEAGSSIALVLLGAGVTGAAGGRAIGFCFGGVLGLVLALRLLGPRTVRVGARAKWSYRRIAGYAGAILVIDGAFMLFSEIDVLLIGALLDSEQVGLFGAPLKILAFVFYPGMALAAGVAPRLARGQGREPNVGALETAIRYLMIVQPLFIAPLVIWAQPLVNLLFGPEYADSAEVMQVFAPYVLLVGLAPLLSTAVNFMGEARRRIPLALAALAINAGIDVALLPEIGIVAGAIGTNVAMLVYVAGHLWICHTSLSVNWRPLLATVARSLAAAAVMAAILFAIGTGSDLGVPLLIGGGAAGSAAYALVILGLREFSPSELSVVREVLRRRAGPGAPPPVAPASAEAAAAGMAPGVPDEAAAPSDAVASYAQQRGPSLRRLAGFLIVHSSCGSGFDFDRLGEGRFEAVCLGCGKRFAYSSPALDAAIAEEPSAAAAASPPPAAAEPSAVRAAPARPTVRRRPPARRRRGSGRRWWLLAALAVLLAALAAAYLIAGDEGEPAGRETGTTAPDARGASGATETPSASEAPTAGRRRVRTGLYALTLPAGWESSRSGDATVLAPRAGGARAELFVARRPDLDLDAMAAQAASLLGERHPGAEISAPVSVEVGAAPGLRLTAAFGDGVERATVTSSGELRYLLLVELSGEARPRVSAEAALVERSLTPTG